MVMKMNISYLNYSYYLIVSQHFAKKNLPRTLCKAQHSEVSVSMT